MAVHGALAAAREREDLHVILIGPGDHLEQQLVEAGAGPERERVSIHHATEVITMDDSPVDAVRKKKEATIMVGFDLVKKGQAEAVVSAGNSGATMAAAVRARFSCREVKMKAAAMPR